MVCAQSPLSNQIQDKCHIFMQPHLTKLKGTKSVVCCFLLEYEGALEVVAVGIGTKSVPRKDYNVQGLVVKDMHAEVVARRALLRYFIK